MSWANIDYELFSTSNSDLIIYTVYTEVVQGVELQLLAINNN